MLKLGLMLSTALVLSTGIAQARIIDTDVVNVRPSIMDNTILNRPEVLDTTITHPAVTTHESCPSRVLTRPAVVESTGCCPSTVLTRPAVLDSGACCPSSGLGYPIGFGNNYGRVLTQSAVLDAMPTYVIPEPRYGYGRFRNRMLDRFDWFD